MCGARVDGYSLELARENGHIALEEWLRKQMLTQLMEEEEEKAGLQDGPGSALPRNVNMQQTEGSSSSSSGGAHWQPWSQQPPASLPQPPKPWQPPSSSWQGSARPQGQAAATAMEQ